MQKKAFVATISSLVVATAAACGLILFFRMKGGASGEEDAGARSRPPLSRVAVAGAEAGNEGEAAGELGSSVGRIRPAFPLEAEEVPLQVFSADINLDGTYDQACAVRRGGAPEIYIVCAIQDPVTTAYARLAPVRTGVTQLRTLLVYFADVTGRQGNALVFSGMNSAGLQVLGIFSVEEDGSAASGFRLREMLALSADGSIQVEEASRSEAYRLGMAAGASYPVVSYHSAPSGNAAEAAPAQIRRSYAWNPSSGVYELSSESRVSAETAGAMVMRRLREGGNDALFRFFKGIWYKTEGGAQGVQLGFDLAADEIVFADGQTQEVFEIESASARGYGVYLVARNSMIGSIRRLVDIEIAGQDEIQVRVSDDVRLRIAVDSSWDGAYRRMRAAAILPMAASGARRIAALLEGEEGGWRASSGDACAFKDGILLIESASGDESEELKYAIYMARDAPVMQVRDAAGKPAFYLLREADGGKVVLQEAAVSALELKATAAPEIELAPIAQEGG